MRREALRTKNNWEAIDETYDVEKYRKHYFYTDFDYLKRKFEGPPTENATEEQK